MHYLTKLAGTLMLALLVGAVAPAVSRPLAAQDACGAGPGGSLGAEEQRAVEAINALRRTEGLGPLTVSPTLSRASLAKAATMAGGSPFDHNDPWRTWQQRLNDCGYDTNQGYASENIAAGSDSGTATVRMWEDSPPHRANMLSTSAQTVGVARAQGGAYGWYWTAVFGQVGSE